MSFKLTDIYQNHKLRTTLYSKGGSIDGTLNVNGDINLNGNSLGNNKQHYLSLLQDTNIVDRTIYPYIDVTGLAGRDSNRNEITSNKWLGGTIALDGCLYCAPYNANKILKINTEYNTATSINITSNYNGDKNQQAKWAGGACSYNNKVYFAPLNANQILVLDINNKTTYTLDYQKSERQDLSGGVVLDPVNWNNQYKGACVDLSENIIFIPADAMQVMKLNPSNDTITYYGLEDFSNNCIRFNTSTSLTEYISPSGSGGALVSNGNIYFSSRGANNGSIKNMFLCYTDSINETISFIDLSNAKIDGSNNVSGNFRASLSEGIVADTEGRYVYLIPDDLNSGDTNDKYIRIDTTDPSNNIELIPIPSGLRNSFSSFVGGILAPDGRIYCGTDNNGIRQTFVIDTFDPSNNSYYLDVTNNNNDFGELYNNFGMLLGCNGYVYSVPFRGSRIQIIHQITPSPQTSGYMVSRYYNKY